MPSSGQESGPRRNDSLWVLQAALAMPRLNVDLVVWTAYDIGLQMAAAAQ